jgi:hypothetical protein
MQFRRVAFLAHRRSPGWTPGQNHGVPRPELRFSISHAGRFADPWKATPWSRNQFVLARDQADGLHFTRHADGFVSCCAVDNNLKKYYVEDPASREVRTGTVLVATIVRPPAVCERAEPHGKPVVYVESPHSGIWVVHRVFFEPDADGAAEWPGVRLPAASLTGTVRIADGGAIVVVSQLMAGAAGRMRHTGYVLRPERPLSRVGGFVLVSADGLVMQEGLNATRPEGRS